MSIDHITKDEFFNTICRPYSPTEKVYFFAASPSKSNFLSINQITVNPLHINFKYKTFDNAFHALFLMIECKASSGYVIDDAKHMIARNTKRGCGNVLVDGTYLTYVGEVTGDTSIVVLENDHGEYAIVSIEDCCVVTACGIDGYFYKL